jgi:hypothetical protein
MRAEQSAWDAVSVTGAELDEGSALDSSAGSVAVSEVDGLLLDESPEQPVRSAPASKAATTARVAVWRGSSTGTA